MTDSCFICETEPIDPEGWYVCDSNKEVICPWCVTDMYEIRKRVLKSK